MLAAGRCARLSHGELDRLRVVEKALEVWGGSNGVVGARSQPGDSRRGDRVDVTRLNREPRRLWRVMSVTPSGGAGWPSGVARVETGLAGAVAQGPRGDSGATRRLARTPAPSGPWQRPGAAHPLSFFAAKDGAATESSWTTARLAHRTYGRAAETDCRTTYCERPPRSAARHLGGGDGGRHARVAPLFTPAGSR